MANAIYPKWKNALLQATAGSAFTGTGTTGVYCALVDTGTYTYNAAHQYYSDLSGIVGTPMEIANKTTTSGVFDGDNVTFSAVTGATVEALVIYVKNAGANTTWQLVAYIDTGQTGLPVTPSGVDIVVAWNASGIFAL